MSLVDLPLLPLGKGRDLDAERGVECPGDLPAASDPGLVERARAAKEALGERVFVLGHHYQRDEVIQFADVTGDSFKLARDAAGRPDAEFIVFCGVHFMAESADILTSPDQQVILPDLAAGCSMADMARLRQVEDAWDAMADAGVQDSVVPVTYMNSSADIKAFCGRNGGVVCTSSNADVALEWALEQKERRGHQDPLPPRPAPRPQHRRAQDGHVPRGLRGLGPAAAGRRPHRRGAAAGADDPVEGPLLRPRALHAPTSSTSSASSTPASRSSSTRSAPTRSSSRPTSWAPPSSSSRRSRPPSPARSGRSAPSSTWCSASRDAHPDKTIVFLDRNVCYCSTMNRIDLPHLVWALENLVAGTVVNQITVDPETEADALLALQRMLDLPGKSHRD